jgi:TolB protein
VAAFVVAGAVLAWGVFWRTDSGEISHDGAPGWSPDSRRIVFSVERNGQTDLFVMHDDGTGRRALASTAAEENAPAFSPDGRLIAFETNRDQNFEIYVMDVDGGNARRLSNHPAHDRSPAWSPDGRQIAFLSDRDHPSDFDVYLMNADGTGVERITTTGKQWAPQFARGGRVLAFQTERDIRAMDLAEGTTRRLTFEPQNGMSPTWSPDGRRLAFATTRNGRLELFTMTADGTDQKVLVSMPGGSALDPRWSPDGARVAFVYVPEQPKADPSTSQPYAIYVVEVASGRVKRLSP